MIKLEEARGLLARAVLTQGPDFVYNPDGKGSCYYSPVTKDFLREVHLITEKRLETALADSSEPAKLTGCLIGVALSLAGETRHLKILGGIYEVARNLPDLLSIRAMHYLRTAQAKQDNGVTWGEAYQEAERGWLDADNWTIRQYPDTATTSQSTNHD